MRQGEVRPVATGCLSKWLGAAVWILAAVRLPGGTNPTPDHAAARDLPADAVMASDRRLLADGLFSRGLYDLAVREYAALADDPAVPGRDAVLFRLGECWRKLKQTAKAEAAYERVAREFPSSAERVRARLQQALLAAEEKRPVEAAALLTPLAGEKLPDDMRGAVLHILGETLEQTGDLAGARARFDQVRRELPDSEYAAYAGLRLGFHLGRSGQSGDRRQALAIYREVAARTNAPRVSAEALFQAGELAFAEHQFADSAACYAELRRRFPADTRAPESLLPAAWAHHHAGQYAAALALAENAEPINPEQRAEWLFLRANANRRLDRLREAADVYQRLLTAFPSDRRAQAARFERLLCLSGLKDYRAVLSESEGFTPSEDRRDGLLWLQAEAALAIEDPARASRDYGALAERFPASAFAADARYRLGWILQRQKSWNEAAGHYRQMADRYPTNALAAQALFAEGVCRAQAGDGAKALQAWALVLERYPGYERTDETLYQKAMEEYRSGDVTAAARSLDTLIARYPQAERRFEARFWRATVRRRQGAIEPAMADLREIIRNSPGNEVEREARLLLGSLLQQQGQNAEAAACFQPLLDGPARARLTADRLTWLSEFQFDRGAYAEAEAAARTLVEREREPAWLQTGWTLLARALRAQRRPEEAISALKHAVEADAQTRFGAEAALRLGEMLMDAGRFAEAEPRLRDAAARSAAPDLQSIRAHAYAGLGRCAEWRGDRDAAVRHFLAVAILYDHADLVPATLDKAAALLAQMGRKEESQAAVAELVARYPASTQAQAWRARLGSAAPAAATPDKRPP